MAQLELRKGHAFPAPDQPAEIINDVTLDDLGRKMADFAADREWDQFHSPRNLLLALVGEVGEVSEIFQWKGEVPRGLSDWDDAEKKHLGEELSDVLLYLVPWPRYATSTSPSRLFGRWRRRAPASCTPQSRRL